MNLGSHRSCLETVSKDLSRQWNETRQYWKDVKGQEFESQYMERFLLLMNKAAAVCEQLDRIVAKARHECE